MNLFNISRRAAVLSLAAMAAIRASAQDFHAKPIKIIVGFAAGGSGDMIARLYAQKMSEILNTPIIVDNKPGANQMIAIRLLLNSPPDGHTLYLASGSSLVQNPGMRRDVGYDPLKDFALIGLVDVVPNIIMVRSGLAVQSVKELITYALANPGKLNYGSSGMGTQGHLAGEVFQSATGAVITHIPFKGDSEVTRELMAGTIDLSFNGPTNALPAIKSGKVRALAVTGPKRLPYLPDVPSTAETGLNALAVLDPGTFHAMVGPAGMPAAIVARLNDSVNKVTALPDVANRMRNIYYAEPATTTPASFRAFVEKELAKWTEAGKVVNLTE